MEKLTLQINNGKEVQEPVILEGITWETARKGEPSKLMFTCVKDESLSFLEGAEVSLKCGNVNVFHGFVFQKRRNKDQHIEVTAYDQIRYLKQNDTYIFEGVRADQIVKRIADDFRLNIGTLENTGYVIPTLDGSNQSVLDTILEAIDITVMNTGNLYYLYDDFGKLTLKNIKSSRSNLIITEETAEDFNYSSSIDSNTYNKIKLKVKSEKDGQSIVHIAQHGENMNKWGVLQYYEEVQNGENASAKAQSLLKLYNKVTRSLSIENQLGDVRVRAGVGVYLDLNLGDQDIDRKLFLVEKAKHVFNNDEHFMTLTLNGNREFYG